VLEWIGKISKYLSIMDVNKGFWGIPLEEESMPLTAFICPIGLFEWTRLPMGVKNGSAAYNRAMSIVLTGLIWKNVITFIDDIIIADNSIMEHKANMELTFQRFRQYGVKLSVEKSKFLEQKIKVLGHYISHKGIESDPSKINDVLNIPPRKNKKELLHFLGSVGWFRKFIKGYSNICRPLTRLTQNSITYQWGDDQMKAFDQLKHILTNPPLLRFFDENLPIHIYTDASGYGVGSALLQPDKHGEEHPVCYSSKVLTLSHGNIFELLCRCRGVTRKCELHF